MTSPTQRNLRRPAKLFSWGSFWHLILRHRRLTAAILFSAAAAIAVSQLTPAPIEKISVVVADSDLAVSSTLDAGSVKVISLPRSSVPSHSFGTTSEVLGKKIAVPLRQGQVLSDTFFVSQQLLLGMPAGTVAAPVRLADPSTSLLAQAGQKVDVIAVNTDPVTGTAISSGENAPPSSPGKSASQEPLVRAAVILWIQKPGEKTTPWTGANTDTSGLIVLAVKAEEAAALANASGKSKFTVVFLS